MYGLNLSYACMYVCFKILHTDMLLHLVCNYFLCLRMLSLMLQHLDCSENFQNLSIFLCTCSLLMFYKLLEHVCVTLIGLMCWWIFPEELSDQALKIIYLCMRRFWLFNFFHMHVFRGSSGIFLVATHKVLYWGGVLLWLVLESNQVVWHMWSMMCQTSNCQLYVCVGKLFFPYYFVTGTPVWYGEGCWNIQTSLCEFNFPNCSIGIYFSTALVRLCYYLIRCCMSLKYVIPFYLLTLMIKSMMLSFFMTICSNYNWRLCKVFFGFVHTSEISFVILHDCSFFLNMCLWWLEEVYLRYPFRFCVLIVFFISVCSYWLEKWLLYPSAVWELGICIGCIVAKTNIHLVCCWILCSNMV